MIGQATVLDGAPHHDILGDQPSASLLGQGCVAPGQAKVTFGTERHARPLLDRRRRSRPRARGGTFPIVTRGVGGGRPWWGLEAVITRPLAEQHRWLRDDLGIIDSAADSHEVAARCVRATAWPTCPPSSEAGAPIWDYGGAARSRLTRGSGRPQIVRAVLEGIAQRAADLVEAAEAFSRDADPAPCGSTAG
ncbi:MAG: hypothetical protein R2701_13295 [Acidimicrobiales bacterium]